MNRKPRVLIIGEPAEKVTQYFKYLNLLPTCHREALARSLKNQIDKEIEEQIRKLNEPSKLSERTETNFKEALQNFRDMNPLEYNKQTGQITTPNPRPLFGKDPNEVFNFKRKRG